MVTTEIFMKKRHLFILLGILLFLPPLSLLPQFVGEVNMCGAVCPRMFFILPKEGIWGGLAQNTHSAWFGTLLVGLILTVTFFFGRLWCSHLCPIGGTTELISRGVPARLKLNYAFVHAPAFRYGYFFIYIAGAVVGVGGIACKLCNFRIIPFLAGAPFVPAFRSYLATSMGMAGLITVALTGFLAKGGRGYCNLLCPIGALDSLTNWLGARLPFSRRMITDHARCNGCGKCSASCMVCALRHDNNQKAVRDQMSCMCCRECEKLCPQGAIRYARR